MGAQDGVRKRAKGPRDVEEEEEEEEEEEKGKRNDVEGTVAGRSEAVQEEQRKGEALNQRVYFLFFIFSFCFHTTALSASTILPHSSPHPFV